MRTKPIIFKMYFSCDPIQCSLRRTVCDTSRGKFDGPTVKAGGTGADSNKARRDTRLEKAVYCLEQDNGTGYIHLLEAS